MYSTSDGDHFPIACWLRFLRVAMYALWVALRARTCADEIASVRGPWGDMVSPLSC
jgi:hypothetical protein